MAKERLYDSLTEEDHDIFGYYATIAYELLYIRFGVWKCNFDKGKQSLEDARVRAWIEYQETMKDTRIPVDKLEGFRSPGNPASKIRGMMISQIFNEILSPHLQGEEYHEACRKISSIMSVRTWSERKRKEAQQAMLEKLRKEGSIVPRPVKKRESRDERRERYLAMARGGIGTQEEILLRGTRNGFTETPVSSLPPQTTVEPRNDRIIEINLVMPIIMADAEIEQRRLSAGGYTPPHGCFRKRRKKVHMQRQAQAV